MSKVFWMIKTPGKAWMLETCAETRNGTTDKLLGKNRGRIAWHKLYNQGYRIVRFEIKEKT